MGSPWFYIVLLGAAVIGYALFLPSRKSGGAQVSSGAADVEATLEHYMTEIEKENTEIIELMAELKQDTTSKQLSLQEQVAELRSRLLEVEKITSLQESRVGKLESMPTHLGNSKEAAASKEAFATPVVESPAQEEIVAPRNRVRDRYPELFDLYDQGKSIDGIAKALKLQRGEVQLILQLASKEESPS
ncbi:hypothetical protein EJP77_13015 [Paenibacillus zeisoli]|uniref:DUF2802 domain-containing protein n=1 Tax=Paenibacillus zeisoli TaxID=2496267 RepID=A0A3S1D4R8_9BACL|nr:hypothetical protein [Paenibacillus zeisoli]RUT29739.1 hypothetical protein EJP77_13015 [Paenibacillus zeisoli]